LFVLKIANSVNANKRPNVTSDKPLATRNKIDTRALFDERDFTNCDVVRKIRDILPISDFSHTVYVKTVEWTEGKIEK